MIQLNEGSTEFSPPSKLELDILKMLSYVGNTYNQIVKINDKYYLSASNSNVPLVQIESIEGFYKKLLEEKYKIQKQDAKDGLFFFVNDDMETECVDESIADKIEALESKMIEEYNLATTSRTKKERSVHFENYLSTKKEIELLITDLQKVSDENSDFDIDQEDIALEMRNPKQYSFLMLNNLNSKSFMKESTKKTKFNYSVLREELYSVLN